MDGTSADKSAHHLRLYSSAEGAAPPKSKKISTMSQFETEG
jgi:hypothetical protein